MRERERKREGKKEERSDDMKSIEIEEFIGGLRRARAINFFTRRPYSFNT